MKLTKKVFRPFLLSIAAAIAIYAVTVVVGDLPNVLAAIATLDLTAWLIVLGLSLLNYGLRFARWQAYLRWLGCRVPSSLSLVYYLAGFAFTTTPGKAGEAVRSLYLKAHGVAYAKSLAAFVIERFIDLMAIVIIALSAGFMISAAFWPVAVAGSVILAALPLLRSRRLRRILMQRGERYRGRLGSALGHMAALLNSSSELLKWRALYAGLLLGIIAWGAEGYAFYLILDYLNVDVPIILAASIYATGILAGAISFIPGGLGSTEAVMILLLNLTGVDTPTAVAATLICRIATLWFAVLIGFVAVGLLETGMGKAIAPSSTKFLS